MIEFSMLCKADVDFADVLRFHILQQTPGEHPANNLTSIIFKEGTKNMEIFSMTKGDCSIFPAKMTGQRQGLPPESTVSGYRRFTGGNKIRKLR